LPVFSRMPGRLVFSETRRPLARREIISGSGWYYALKGIGGRRKRCPGDTTKSWYRRAVAIR
jgi:hypothetical protein